MILLYNTDKKLEKALNVTETVFNNYNMKTDIEKTNANANYSEPIRKRFVTRLMKNGKTSIRHNPI